jgi:hypothetical protein
MKQVRTPPAFSRTRAGFTLALVGTVCFTVLLHAALQVLP